MSDQSVFHVARELIECSEGKELNSIALQKLCFFSFVWYARLTGRKLYPEQTWAMKHGPVVGDLLSAHSRQAEVSADTIDRAMDEWQLDPGFEDSYAKDVVDGVYEAYGPLSYWDLRNLSHEEYVWRVAWDQRGTSARARMNSDSMVSYYLGHLPVTSGKFESGRRFTLNLDLPDPQVIFADGDVLDEIESMPAGPCESFVERLLSLSA